MKQSQLQSQLLSYIRPELFLDDVQYRDFAEFVVGGKIVQDANPTKHCCVFFIPYNARKKELFIVHHKKAQQWIVPGGHIEAGELLEDAVVREAREELGLNITTVSKPVLFTVMPVHSEGKLCAVHYDIWHILPASQVTPDMTEFYETKWVSIADAKRIITHPLYVQALDHVL
jgi:8-oxo-dGTP pyrophosphatase MutT (NUDIX family)